MSCKVILFIKTFCKIKSELKNQPTPTFDKEPTNQYHRLSRWFVVSPYKGSLPALESKDSSKVRQPHVIYLLSPLGLFFLIVFYYRLTRKRVYIFFHTHLIIHHIFIELVPYILFYLFCIFSYCIYVISPTPKMPISILIF